MSYPKIDMGDSSAQEFQPGERRAASDIEALEKLVHPDYINQADAIIDTLAIGHPPEMVEKQRQLLRRLLTEVASKDHMTGLNNAKSAEVILERVMEYCRENDLPLTVIFVDGDEFGKINKQINHAAGDKTIRLFAEALKRATRGTDIQARLGEEVENERVVIEDQEESQARIGGDEFLLILPGAKLEHAKVIFNRFMVIVHGMAATQLPEYEQRFGKRLSATAGAAQFDPSFDHTPLHLTGRADSALLYAKQHGLKGNIVASTVDPQTNAFQNALLS